MDDLKSQYPSKKKEGTPEPKTKTGKPDKKPIFVIQKHDASTLHYDFRIEVEGILASWAVPKGPSTDPSEKRLAIQVEDHPLSYGSFEGTIPKGHYGAGTVMIWDQGTYRNIKKENGKLKSLKQCIQDGEVNIWLDGVKVQGGYALTRFKGDANNKWLLVKMKDSESDARRRPLNTQTKSVASGRSMEEISKHRQKASARS